MNVVTPEVRDQVAGWRRLFVVFAVALFVLLAIVAGFFLAARREASKRDSITGCRSKVAAALSAAQVDNDLAFDDLVIGLAEQSVTGGSLDRYLERIRETKADLQAARDARVAFEEHPTGSC